MLDVKCWNRQMNRTLRHHHLRSSKSIAHLHQVIYKSNLCRYKLPEYRGGARPNAGRPKKRKLDYDAPAAPTEEAVSARQIVAPAVHATNFHAANTT